MSARKLATAAIVCLTWLILGCVGEGTLADAVAEASPLSDKDVSPGAEKIEGAVITGIRFDRDALKRRADGSDNWVVTWADDGSQYVAFGDGGGFGGSDDRARVSLGVAQISGDFENFTVRNVWGGFNALADVTFSGKSYGLLAVGQDLWLWRTGDGSDDSAFALQDLFVSHDNGLTFEATGVRFTPEQFGDDSAGFFAPTFLQFGPGYRDARDDYVYVYAPENKSGNWEVQIPGEVILMRVPQDRLPDRDAYEFFAGLDSRGIPVWTQDVTGREPIFSDPENGVMRTSVTYNAGLGRYLLVTQQRTLEQGGYIGIYESGTPWGPWNTVLLEDAWSVGLQRGSKTVYWNFSNAWTSDDGRRSVLVYTGPGPDNFGVIPVEFETIFD